MYTKEITIWCDYCNEWDQYSWKSVSEARKELRRRGWTFKDKKDKCPHYYADVDITK